MTFGRYNWGGDSLPQIENHSLCKHKVIRDYLIEYICVRFKGNLAHPKSVFQLTIIDGFAGGGLYDNCGKIQKGSPLVIGEAVKEAENILKYEHGKDRVNLDIDVICIEKDVKAAKHLKNILTQPEYSQEKIQVWPGEFGQLLPKVIQFIKIKSNKRGKCLFILDQYGYSDVLMSQLQTILAMNSEVILTFAISSLVTFLSESNKSVLQNMEFNDSEITNILSLKDRPENCRENIEFIFAKHIQQHSQAQFRTPFLIRSDKSNWGYWLVHLSNHYKARDVMMDVHWKHSNELVHYGKPGLDMLSYRSKLDTSYTGQRMLSEEFRFDKAAKARSMEVLPEEIARVIHENQKSLKSKITTVPRIKESNIQQHTRKR